LAYNVRWNKDARDDLAQIDKSIARRIIDKITGHLASNPADLGKPLKGIFHGLYRYQCGDWRIIYALDREEKLIMILRAGHRKDVYKKQ
jgi:mRNA interferase RelE/StbE